MGRIRDRKRRSTANRGYGRRHQEFRLRLAPLVARGAELCTRCGLPILPGQRWHLDHRDDRLGYLGPAHGACNEGASSGGRPGKVSRKW